MARIKIGIDFAVNKTGLNDLSKQLQNIQSKAAKMQSNGTLTKDFQEASKAAKQLDTILNTSWNSKLNQLDLTKFNNSVRTSFGSIQNLQTQLNKGGVDGQRTFNNMASAILNTNTQLTKSSKLLDSMAASLARTIQWTISSKIINTVTGSIQKAWTYSKNLDSSLNDIRIVTGKSADEMARFAVQANKAAGSLGATTLDYTKASLIYYQQGLDQQDVDARTATTLKTANVTGQSAEAVSEELTAVWNGYKVGAEETEKYVDKLAAVAANSASNLQELATGMSKVASAANLMGVDIDQLNAMIATTVSVTRQAPESVGTAYKTIFARMADIEAGEDTETTLGQYSGKMKEIADIDVLDETGELRDMGEVIEEVGEKWTNMSRETQIALAQAMAGTRQYNNLLSLFDGWDMYTKSLKTSEEAIGTLDEQNSTYLDSTAAHMKQLQNAQEALYTSMFDSKGMSDFYDMFTGLVNIVNRWVKAMGGGLPVLNQIALLMGSIFNKQISNGILNQINNIRTIAQNRAANKTKSWIANNNDISMRNESDSALDKANKAGLEVEQKATRDLFAIRKSLTTEELQSYENARKKIGEVTREIEIIKQRKNLLKEGNLNEADSLKNQKRELENRQETLQILKDIQKVQNSAEEQSKEGLTSSSINAFVGTQSKKAFNGMEVEDLNFADDSNLPGHEEEKESLQTLLKAAQTRRLSTEEQELLNQYIEREITLNNSALLGIQGEEAAEAGKTAELEMQKKKYKEIIAEINKQGTATKKVQNVLKGVNAALAAGNALYGILNAVQDAKKNYKDEEAQGQATVAAIAQGIGNAAPMIGMAFGPVGMAIGGGVSLLSNIISQKSQKEAEKLQQEAEERAKQIQQKYEETLKKVKTNDENISTLEDLATEYNALSYGVGEYGQNVSLTADQFDRYNEITGKIAEMNPDLVKGWTAEGNAILANKDSMQEYIEMMKEKAELDYKSLYTDPTNVQQSLENSQTTEDEKETNAKNTKEKIGKYGAITNTYRADKYDKTKSDRIGAMYSVNSDYNKARNNDIWSHVSLDDTYGTDVVLGRTSKNIVRYNSNAKKDYTQLWKDTVSSTEDFSLGQQKIKEFWSNYIKESNGTTFVSAELIGKDNKFDQSYQNLIKYIMDTYKVEEEQAKQLILVNKDNEELITKAKTARQQKDNYEAATLKTLNQEQDALIKERNKFTLNQIKYSTETKEQFEALSAEQQALFSEMVINNDSAWVETINEETGERTLSFSEENNKKNLENAKKAMEFAAGLDEETIEKLSQLKPENFNSYDEFLKAVASFKEQFIGNNKLFAEDTADDFANLLGLDNIDASVELISSDVQQKIQDINKAIKEATGVDINVGSFGFTTEQLNNVDLNELNIAGIDAKNIESLQEFADLYERIVATAAKAEEAKSTIAKNDEQLYYINQGIKEFSENGKITESTIKDIETAFPELAKIIDKQSEDYRQKLIEIREETEQSRIENVKAARTSWETIIQYYEDNPPTVEADVEQYENAMKELLDADYNVKVEVEADIKSDIEDGWDVANQFDKIKDVIADDLTVTFKEAREIADAGFAEILQNAKATADGQIRINKETLDYFVDGEQSKLQATKQEKLAQLQMEREQLVAQRDALKKRLEAIKEGLKASTKEEAKESFVKIQKASVEYQAKVKATEKELEVDKEQAIEAGKINKQMFTALGGMYTTNSENLQQAEIDATNTQKEEIDTRIANLKQLSNAYGVLSRKIKAAMKGEETDEEIEGGNTTGGGKANTSGNKELQDIEILDADLNTVDSNAIMDWYENNKDQYKATLEQLYNDTEDELKNLDNLIGENDAVQAAITAADYSIDQKQLSAAVDSQSNIVDLLQDQVDRYHDINIEIEKIETKLKRLQNVQKNLTGQNLLDNLNEQLTVLEQQKQLYEQKAEMARQEALAYQTVLQGQGFTFTDDGYISNYNELMTAKVDNVNNLISQYNSATKDEQKNLKKEVDQAKKDLENLKKTVTNFDNAKEKTLVEMEDKITETTQKEIEIKITKFSTEVEIRLNMVEAEKDFNEFMDKAINKLEDDDYVGQTRTVIKNIASYYTTDALSAATRQVNDIMSQISSIDAIGTSSIYGDNKAKAIEDLKSYQQKITKGLVDIEDLRQNIQKNYISALDKSNQKLTEHLERYNQINSYLNHDIQLIKLLYGDSAYTQMSNYYDKITQNNNEMLDVYKRMKEQVEARMNAETDSEVFKALEKQWTDLTSKINSAIESQLKNLTDKYSNETKRIIDDMTKKLTGGSTLNYAKEEWNLLKKQSELYLDDINRAYETTALKNKFGTAIKSNTSETAQKRLNKLRDEELKKLKEKDKLTQYDVDRANKLYELELKRIALDEAQQNKSQMRLRRDSQGNYSYQFVQDTDQVNQAKEEVLQAEQDLFNFDKDRNNEVIEEMLNTYEEYTQKIISLQSDQTKSAQEKQQLSELYFKEYNDNITALAKETSVTRINLHDDVFNNLNMLYDKNLYNFINMSEQEQNEFMNNLLPNWNSTAAEMSETVNGEGGLLPLTQDSVQELKDLTIQYQSDIEQLESAAGVSFSSIAAGIDQDVVKTKELISENSNLIDKYGQEIDEIAKLNNQLDILMRKYSSVQAAAEQAAQAAYNQLLAQQQLAANAIDNGYSSGSVGNYINNGAGYITTTDTSGSKDTIDTKQVDKTSNGNKDKESPAPPGLTPEQKQAALGKGQRVKLVERNGALIGIVGDSSKATVQMGGKAPTGYTKTAIDYSKTTAEVVQVDKVQAENKYLVETLDQKRYWVHFNFFDNADQMNLTQLRKAAGLRTGGYTGSWSSDEGRLAVLHQKELVLNKEDTSNILTAVNTVRNMEGLLSSLGNAVSNRANGLLGLLNMGFASANTSKDSIEQNVHIEANFPNVTDRQEIENAFDNLVNIAAMRAYKNIL